MGIAGNAAVIAPQLAAPRTGLLATARDATVNRLEESTSTPSSDANPTPRWENGFAWDPENGCGDIGIYDPCDLTAGMSDSENPDIRSYDPVAIWAGDDCTSKGVRDREARARRRLLAGQSKKLAQELWNGALAIASGFPNAYLSELDASNTVTDGSVSEANGLACLEQALADCSISGTGMIHVTPGLMTHLYAARLVERFGNVFRTANDTLVVADAGYTGEGPNGVPPVDGSVWAYATDLVYVRLGAVFTSPTSVSNGAMDQSPPDNSLHYRAERLAAVTFDGCCLLAAEFDINVCSDLETS